MGKTKEYQTYLERKLSGFDKLIGSLEVLIHRDKEPFYVWIQDIVRELKKLYMFIDVVVDEIAKNRKRLSNLHGVMTAIIDYLNKIQPRLEEIEELRREIKKIEISTETIDFIKQLQQKLEEERKREKENEEGEGKPYAW